MNNNNYSDLKAITTNYIYTRDLKADTSDLQITITPVTEPNGKTYYDAVDQRGNKKRGRDPQEAEVLLRATVDTRRRLEGR